MAIYRSRRRANARNSRYNRSSVTSGSRGTPDNAYAQTTTRRHDFVAEHHNGNLVADKYIAVDMVKFKRTFSATDPDVPDTPVAGNNYDTPSVHNGGLIKNFQKRITISNRMQSNASTATVKSFYLDVYKIVLSYFDGYLWEQFDSGTSQNSLINYVQSTSDDEAGEVEFLTSHPILTANNVKNNKFTQRYLQLIGRIKVDQGKSINLNFNGLPSKCRRANQGMFYGLVFHNNSLLNGAATLNLSMGSESSFEEIPSEERLPFIY